MRMGNRVEIYKYNGPLIHQEEIKDLYQAEWINSPDGVYPDRPQSPKSKDAKGDEGVPSIVVPVPAKKQAYRPPHATGALAAQLRREKGELEGIKKIVTSTPLSAAAPAPVLNLIPGQAPPTASKVSNPKKNKSVLKGAAYDEEEVATPAIPTAPVVKVAAPVVAAPVKVEAKEPALDADGVAKKLKVS